MALAGYAAIFFDLGETLVTESAWVAGARDVLLELKELARVGVLSNTGDLTRDQLRELLPADFDFALFDPVLVLLSSEIGLSKPDPRIFKKAVHATGKPASHCLYCSESLTETLAAQKVGMNAVRVGAFDAGSLAQLREVLRTLDGN